MSNLRRKIQLLKLAVVLTLDLCTTFDYFYTANCSADNSIFGVLIKDLQLFQTYFIYVLPPLIFPFNCGMNFLPEETTTNFARSIQAFIFIPVSLFFCLFFLAFDQIPLTADEPSAVRRNSRHVTVVLILFRRGRIWRRCVLEHFVMSAALLCHTWSQDLHGGFRRRYNECQPVTFSHAARTEKS